MPDGGGTQHPRYGTHGQLTYAKAMVQAHNGNYTLEQNRLADSTFFLLKFRLANQVSVDAYFNETIIDIFRKILDVIPWCSPAVNLQVELAQYLRLIGHLAKSEDLPPEHRQVAQELYASIAYNSLVKLEG